MTFELVNAAKKYAHECSGEFNPDIRDAFIHGAEWICKQFNDKFYNENNLN